MPKKRGDAAGDDHRQVRRPKPCDMPITNLVSGGSSSLPPKSANMFSKAGMTIGRAARSITPIAMHEDRDRIDQRAAHLALQLHALLDVDGEAVQDRVEDAAHLAGVDQVHEQLVEDLRVALERIAEGRAVLDRVLDVLEDRVERLVVALAREDVEALHQRQAGVDHGRELADEDDQLLGRDRRAEAELDAARPSS